jgi:hypothetical protein
MPNMTNAAREILAATATFEQPATAGQAATPATAEQPANRRTGHARRPPQARRAARWHFASVIALLAFVIVSLCEIIHVAYSVHEALLDADEIFRKNISVGAFIAIAFVILLLRGWFESLETYWKTMSKRLRWSKTSWPLSLKTRLYLWRLAVGTVCIASLFIVTLFNLPLRVDIHIAGREPTTSRGLVEQPHEPRRLPTAAQSEAPPHVPSHEPTQAGPRMASGDDVCNLFENFTDAEWKKCMRDILTHPNRTGTGGPVCTMVRGRCLPWPPLPPRRPPLDILPNSAK